jgi:hypothetical protein
MKLEEFERATEAELRKRANTCFDRAEVSGGLDKPYLYTEAQFYIGEIERRKQGKANTFSFWMEVAVILLILGEIVLGIYGTKLAIKQGNDADAYMTKQNAILNQLNDNMAVTAKTLNSTLSTMQSMNDRLAVELGRMSQITVDLSMSGTEMTISNQGNVDLQFWGFKVADLPARIMKRPVLLRRSANIEVDGLATDIHKATKGEGLQVYIRDDFNNEFVAEGHQQVGPNIMGFATRLQVVQRGWSSK